MEKIRVRIIDGTQEDKILDLIMQLNAGADRVIMQERLVEIFSLAHFKCFGLFVDQELVGLSGLWIFTRFYSGKQVEIDNFILDENYRSKGYGKILLDHIQEYALSIDCKSIELNAYIVNERGLRFYESKNFEKLGYHLVKKL